MTIKSLETLPTELLIHIAGYVATPLFDLKHVDQSWTDTWWNASPEQLAALKAFDLLNSLALVCRTTYSVLNPCLYRFAARWKDLGLPESPVPVGELVYHGELGLKVIDKLIGAGLVGNFKSGPRKFTEETDRERETFNYQTRHLPSRGSAELWAGRYRSVSVRPFHQRIRRWTNKKGLPQSPPKAILPEDHLYFNPNGSLKPPWQSHQLRLLELWDNFHLQNYNNTVHDYSDVANSRCLNWEHPGFNRMFRTPLHVAASEGNLEAMKRFLDVGFNPNALANGHCSCLPLPAGEFMHCLSPSTMNDEPDSRRVKPPCWTPLHTAICHGEFEAAKMLIAYGACIRDVTEDTNYSGYLEESQDSLGISALHMAAGFGDVRLLDHLDAAGFCNSSDQLGLEDEDGLTPFFWAVLNGHLETTAAWLLDHGVDIDEPTSNLSALEYTLSENFFYEACRLIEMGACISETAEDSVIFRSSLDLACSRNVNEGGFAENTRGGRSTDNAWYRSRVDDPFEEARIDTVKLMLAKGRKLETDDGQYTTPLSSALSNGLPRTAAYLLDAGAAVSGEDALEALTEMCCVNFSDGSGLATFLAVVDHYKKDDPSFVVSALFWLLDRDNLVFTTREIFREAIRWMVAKGASPSQMNETELHKAYLLAAPLDIESADILTRSQLHPSPHEFEELIEPTSSRWDENLMIGFLDLNRHPWQDIAPSTLYKCFSCLINGYVAGDRLATDQAILRFLDYARDWIPSISPEKLRRLLRCAFGRGNGSTIVDNPRSLGFYTAVRHRLVQVLCEAGAGTFTGSGPEEPTYDHYDINCQTCFLSSIFWFQRFPGGRDTKNWTYDEVAPAICTLAQNGFDFAQSCDRASCRTMGHSRPVITKAIAESNYKMLHAILSASPGLLQTEHCANLKLLHTATWVFYCLFHHAAEMEEDDDAAVKLANAALRNIALLRQHGADQRERDNGAMTPLQHILKRAMFKPQRFFGHPFGGQIAAKYLLPRAVRLLWHPSLAEAILPTGEQLEVKERWRGMTVAEYLKVLLSGAVDEQDLLVGMISTEDQNMAAESRRIIAASLRKICRVWEDEADGGRLRIEMLPMEWAGVADRGGDNNGGVEAT
ncbi:hypothetical protein PspLS_01542 [Pyricularia sp. CBS 133598]|nr:hypothetical protein PspLS_01542 [Pyricularia sp. CBS 133598]